MRVHVIFLILIFLFLAFAAVGFPPLELGTTNKLVSNQFYHHLQILSRSVRNEFFAQRATCWCKESFPSNDSCNSAKKCQKHLGATMVEVHNLINFGILIKDVLSRDIPGDVMECGTWQGGSSIVAARTLRYFGVKDRKVWMADSFAGHPSYNGRDSDFAFTKDCAYYAAPIEWVEQHLSNFGVRSQVALLKGWFKDTLGGNKPLPEKLAALRMDADAYSSTTQILNALYDRVADGGVIVIDDWYAYPQCREAVHDFLQSRDITPDIVVAPPEKEIEAGPRAYWIKGKKKQVVQERLFDRTAAKEWWDSN